MDKKQRAAGYKTAYERTLVTIRDGHDILDKFEEALCKVHGAYILADKTCEDMHRELDDATATRMTSTPQMINGLSNKLFHQLELLAFYHALLLHPGELCPDEETEKAIDAIEEYMADIRAAVSIAKDALGTTNIQEQREQAARDLLSKIFGPDKNDNTKH